VDNRAIALVLGEIADLLEIKGENVFKIRAYRSAAETLTAMPDPIARMTDAERLAIPGIGKDLAKRLQEMVETGTCGVREDLLREFPATILELLRLQGVGPKTVKLLYETLNVRSLADLSDAARSGRLRGIRSMGAKKEALILKAIEERQRDAGRHLLSHTAALAAELITHLEAHAPDAGFTPVGSLRRGCETCGDIDILAVGADATLMDHFVVFPRVERVLGQGDTKSSVRIAGGYQADLRLVPAESRGAALQYFTGSKAHNVALRDRALQRGLKLNEYGLFSVEDGARVAGTTEDEIYEALGLCWVPPELREDRGELDAATARALPRLLARSDLRGDLHMHTTVTDGRDTLEAMATAARECGHSYIAVTDHSQALAMANGLDEQRALEHAARVRALNGRIEGLTLLAGIECDILADGRLDLADDCLAQLDIVIASVHSNFSQDERQMTDRVLRAMECPWVDVIGHPTGRLLLRREAYTLDFDRITAAAAGHGVALEINSQPHRLDLNDTHARLARDRGVRLVVSTDAHSTSELGNLEWGVQTARRGWVSPDAVLNTRGIDELRPLLRRHRRTA
jgi:DNA polymerase (family 10)